MKKISNIKKKTLSAFITLSIALSFTACGGEGNKTVDGNSSESEISMESSSNNVGTYELTSGEIPTFEDIVLPEGTKLTIGYLAQNETDQFNVYLGEVLKDEAEKYNGRVEIIESDAQSQATVQVSQAEDMVIRNPDVVIINAVDGEASAPAVTALTEAGIPVVCLNTSVSNIDLCASYVGIDDEEVGEMLVEMIADAIGGKGTINVIQGLLGHPANERRWSGIQKAVENEYPDITINATQAADWDRNKALNVTEDWISGGADFDAVVSLNDEMAMAALNAFEAAGLDKYLVGADALPEMLELIKEGKIYGTVFQNGDVESRCALSVAISVALGVEVDKEYMIPNEIVTQENVDDYIGRNVLE